ncbi:hypothetical protein [Agathobaculum sp. Marseille-P7918]|uniref:hypothetical protein n=1 Tax=Agathobaculum sp. Marseille-P7918 TaxID=2479843 RepID=UPI000F6444C1|nr:hypothetical protein [Agathobaculum sp. Marseille-P7918]
MKRYALWLLIPFAVAAASDCGAPVTVLAWIALGWCIGTLALLERYRRRAEQARQQRLSHMRHEAWEDNHAS